MNQAPLAVQGTQQPSLPQPNAFGARPQSKYGTFFMSKWQSNLGFQAFLINRQSICFTFHVLKRITGWHLLRLLGGLGWVVKGSRFKPQCVKKNKTVVVGGARTHSEHCWGDVEHSTEPPNAYLCTCNLSVPLPIWRWNRVQHPPVTPKGGI